PKKGMPARLYLPCRERHEVLSYHRTRPKHDHRLAAGGLLKGPPMKPITDFLDRVIHGDCIPIMRSMPSASVDLILTDPPYLVNYHARDGRHYANDTNDRWLCPAFREIHRVLKPDCFCISFYGWPWVERFMHA